MPGNSTKNTIQKTVAQLLRTAGIDTPSQIPVANNTTEFSTFSPDEFRNMMTNRASNLPTGSASLDNLMNSLSRSAHDSDSWAKEIDDLKILTPEIDDAADIVVSSIFSPTDMQTNALTVKTEFTNLGTEAEEQINKILTDFFNDKDHLAEKAERWIKDARYGTGATGIVMLPASNIRNLNALSDVKDKNLYSSAFADEATLGSGESLEHSFESFEEKMEKSTEAWIPSTKYGELDEQLDVALEAAELDVLDEINESRKEKNEAPYSNFSIIKDKKDLKKAIKDLFIDNKSVRFYNDVTIFEKSMKQESQTVNKITKDVFKRCFGKSNVRMYVADPEFDLNKQDNVVVVEFPSSTLIPICVPNDPSKHLAYMAIIDQWGQPLGKGFIDDYYKHGSSSLNDANKRAVTSQSFASQFNNEVSDKQRFDLSAGMFTTAMKVLIKMKMQEYGLGNIDIEAHSSLGSSLFYYLLQDNKIGMVFIPASFVVYTAFDYHKNGTGKSLIEDISTIIALRNTLTMAGIMSAAENSVNNRTIEVNVDEKNTNPIQTLEMVRNMYIDKKVVKLNHNPMDIQRGLYNKALTLLPKNIRGIKEGLTATVEHRSTGAVQPDENLRELLTKWLIQKLHVPNSTMNDVGQNEFSRSVAITNLHFNNQLHCLQRITEFHLSRYVRIFTSFSYELQEEIRNVIKNIKRTDNVVKDQPNAVDGKFDENVDFNDAGTVDKYLGLVISNMKIVLPKPRAVVDKAQYAEIEQYIGTVDKIINDIYSDDMVADDGYRKAFAMKKAKIKADYIRQFIQEIGFHSDYELPSIEDVNDKELQDIIETLINTQRMFNVTHQLIARTLNSQDADGSNIKDADAEAAKQAEEAGQTEEPEMTPEETNPDNMLDENGNLASEAPAESNPNELDENGNLPEEAEEFTEATPNGPIETGGAPENQLDENGNTPEETAQNANELNENGETPEEANANANALNENGETPEEAAQAEQTPPAKAGRKSALDLEFPEEGAEQPPKF